MLLGDHCYCPKQSRFFKFLTLKIILELITIKLNTEEKKKKYFINTNLHTQILYHNSRLHNKMPYTSSTNPNQIFILVFSYIFCLDFLENQWD